MFDWEKAFSNTSFDEKVTIFNRTVLNILDNFIPHERIERIEIHLGLITKQGYLLKKINSIKIF